MATNLDAVLDELLGTVLARLDSTVGVEPPALVSIAPGATVAWDSCCVSPDGGGGQMWARVARMLPRGSTGQLLMCGATDIEVEVRLGMVRCVHTVSDDGTPPTAAQMTGDALGALDDAQVLYAVLSGWPDTLVTEWLPLGPRGGCGGGEWAARMRLPDLCWVPE